MIHGVNGFPIPTVTLQNKTRILSSCVGIFYQLCDCIFQSENLNRDPPPSSFDGTVKFIHQYLLFPYSERYISNKNGVSQEFACALDEVYLGLDAWALCTLLNSMFQYEYFLRERGSWRSIGHTDRLKFARIFKQWRLTSQMATLGAV